VYVFYIEQLDKLRQGSGSGDVLAEDILYLLHGVVGL